MKLDILASGAHPDDVELGAGGIIAKEISSGKAVGIIDLTQDELDTRGSTEIRCREATKTKELLGVTIRENLRFRDGFFVGDEAHQLAAIKKIHQYQPDVVLYNTTNDHHTDHGKGNKLINDAYFLSELRRIETTLDGKAQGTWRPKVVYHYIQWKNIIPGFVVDITGFMEAKVNAMLAYSLQFYGSSNDKPTTPISDRSFSNSVIYRARDLGRLIGTDFAEGFTRERVAVVDTLFSSK